MIAGYLGLFFAAFGAATLLPLQSEAVLVGLLLSGHYSLWLLLGVATLGNVLAGRDGYDVSEGSVQFEGRDLLELAPEERAAALLACNPQAPCRTPPASDTLPCR